MERRDGHPGAAPYPQDDMDCAMLRLYQRIDAALPRIRNKIVQFTASQRGEGTSTIVRAFGRVVANRIGKSVLIIDACRERVAEAPPWRAPDLERAEPVGRDRPPAQKSPAPSVFDAEAVRALFSELRTRFDLVLVDSSPAVLPAGLALSGKVDAVVLVVEADRARWPVALHAREAIERSGGSLLGIVFNKRRQYIPEPLYQLL